MNIYVGNLSFQASEDELRTLFAEFGEIATVKIIKDNFTGRSRGFAFVEMPDTEGATKAIDKLNNSFFQSQFITVNEARPKTGSFTKPSGNRY